MTRSEEAAFKAIERATGAAPPPSGAGWVPRMIQDAKSALAGGAP